MVGVLLVAVVVSDEDRVFYQEVDFVLTAARSSPSARRRPARSLSTRRRSKDACRPDDPVGMVLFHLVDEVAECYLDLIDAIDDEIDELEENVEKWPPTRIRTRISTLRHDLLNTRKHLSPLRDAVHKVVDDRAELRAEGGAFPRNVQLHFADTYDKLLRATEGLETSRELVAGVRDYFQATVANDQNEVVSGCGRRVAAPRPTFIVGVYGQNFRHIPELHWGLGYAWSWMLIVVTTVAQLAFFRWKRWI